MAITRAVDGNTISAAIYNEIDDYLDDLTDGTIQAGDAALFDGAALSTDGTLGGASPSDSKVATEKAVKTYADSLGGFVTGDTKIWMGPSIPSGWFNQDGSAKSRSTYADLYNVLTLSKGAATISQANPGVVTLASGDLSEGDCIELTTDGVLPTGLSANTNYYWHSTGAGTGNLASSRANLSAGTYIETTSAGSGTHTLRHCPHGISGASDFLLPNAQGVSLTGVGSQDINGRTKTGPALGEVREDQFQGHWTDIYQSNGGGAGSWVPGGAVPNSRSTGDYAADVDSYLGKDPQSDTVNGTPRTGAYTRPNEIGVYFIIKY